MNFGTWLSVLLIEGVRLIGGPPNRGFTVFKTFDWLNSWGELFFPDKIAWAK